MSLLKDYAMVVGLLAFMKMVPWIGYFLVGLYAYEPIMLKRSLQEPTSIFSRHVFLPNPCLASSDELRVFGFSRVYQNYACGFNSSCGINLSFCLLSWDSDTAFDVKPFSLRKRTQPSDLIGSWKVFEVSATPIYGEETVTEEGNGTPYVYLCTETLKNRTLPENLVYFGEEEMLDMQDAAILWLPGGVTSYVDINKDGILCLGVGWYSDEGINLVMERDYGLDGKLKEVRWKTEVKRRWSNPNVNMD